jgi:hypothetical protein
VTDPLLDSVKPASGIRARFRFRFRVIAPGLDTSGSNSAIALRRTTAMDEKLQSWQNGR